MNSCTQAAILHQTGKALIYERSHRSSLYLDWILPDAMTLQQLAYFVAAVEHGSFSAAADALYIAQPSLSEQIRRL